jgi:hypothetical protein
MIPSVLLAIGLIAVTVVGPVLVPELLDGAAPTYACCTLAAVVGVPAQGFVHEMGHLLAALAVRLRVTEFSVGGDLRRPGYVWWGVTVRLGLRGPLDQVRFLAEGPEP